MTIYISYHPLDYDFAFELLLRTRNLGLKSQLRRLTTDIIEDLDPKNIDDLVLILRPEYLHSTNPKSLNDMIGRAHLVIPILRIPISIDDWIGHTPLTPMVDCSRHIDESLEIILDGLDSILRTKINAVDCQPEEIYINTLRIRLNKLCHPLLLLEHNNFGADFQHTSPLDRLLSKIRFSVSTVGVQSSRNDLLYDIWKHCKSFALICGELDRSILIYHLLNKAIEDWGNCSSDVPIPILLNAEMWDPNLLWEDWLSSQIMFDSSSIDKIANGNFAIYIYGSESGAFLSHPYKQSFEAWIWGAKRPKYMVLFYNNADFMVEDYGILPVVSKSHTDWSQLEVLFTEFSNRPYSLFISRNIHGHPLPYQYFLLRNPVFAAILLSLRFNNVEDFTKLSITDCYSIFIEELMVFAGQRNHMDISQSNNITPLLDLAITLTEDKTKSLSIDKVNAIVGYQTEIVKYLDAGILVYESSKIQFSLNILEEYFAGRAIVERGLPNEFPKLTLNRYYRRQRNHWDNPVIIASFITSNKEDLLDKISVWDPLLALDCIASNEYIIASSYSHIMSFAINSLSTVGDFRLDLALLLYQIEPIAGKSILLEVMRNAYWCIRQEAYNEFLKLETPLLSGLTEAISHLKDDSRVQISNAIQRLRTNALSTLFHLLHDDVSAIRQNAAWALGELGDSVSVPALISLLDDTSIDVCVQAIRSLGKIKDVSCVAYLAEHLQSNSDIIRNEIGFVLSSLQGENAREFSLYFNQNNPTNRRLIVTEINKCNINSVIDFLIAATFDIDIEVRIAAVSELSAFADDEKVMARLKGCLNDMSKSPTNNFTVSAFVSRVLANLKRNEMGAKSALQSSGNPQKTSQIVKARLLSVKHQQSPIMQDTGDQSHFGKADEFDYTPLAQAQSPSIASFDNENVLVIINHLRNGTWSNTTNAAKDLKDYVKKLGVKTSLHVVNQILETLNDENWIIRWTGIEALGLTGNIQVVPHLIRSLADSNWKIRVAAIRALAEIGDKSAVPSLSKLLTDVNPVVREATAEALGVWGGQTALQALELAASDQEEFVRLAAIESLGKLHHRDTERPLLAGLQDESEHVRWAAANGLSNIANMSMVKSLIPSLQDTSGPYWEQKRICDVILDILKQVDSSDARTAIIEWHNNQLL